MMHVCMWVCTRVCMQVCMHVCMQVGLMRLGMAAQVENAGCTCTYAYMHMYVCVHAYMRTCTCTRGPDEARRVAAQIGPIQKEVLRAFNEELAVRDQYVLSHEMALSAVPSKPFRTSPAEKEGVTMGPAFLIYYAPQVSPKERPRNPPPPPPPLLSATVLGSASRYSGSRVTPLPPRAFDSPPSPQSIRTA